MAYGYYYDLDLYSDFTYFLNNPERGDQFEQPDKRVVSGLKASHTVFHSIGYSEGVILPLGIVLLACTLLYLIPRTAVPQFSMPSGGKRSDYLIEHRDCQFCE